MRIRRARAWSDDTQMPGSLGYGYTMVELCGLELIDSEPHCRTEILNQPGRSSNSASYSNPQSAPSIAGHVITSDGVGLSDIPVIASPKRLKDTPLAGANKLRFWTVSDSMGAYTLENLPEGEYTIRSGGTAEYPSVRLEARTGVNYADLVLVANQKALAEGQVLNAWGEPLPGVTVLPILLGQPSVLTDDNGYFALPVTLRPTVRTFALRFQLPGFREQTTRIDLLEREVGNADDLTVVMQPVDSWTSVGGIVQSGIGDPLARRTVELRSTSSRQSHKTKTDRDGRYEFPFVEIPGEYQLIVHGGTSHRDHVELVSIDADAHELNVVAESYDFGDVTGRIVNLNGEPVPDFDLVLRNSDSRQPNAVVSTDAYGNFDVNGVPAGELIVASQSAPSILVQGLELKPGGRLHVPLILDWGEHELRGIVLDTNNNPVPASRVILRWSHEEEGVTTNATRRTASDTQGFFAFNNLGPGPHTLQVEAPGFLPVAIDHDLSRQGYDLTVRLN